MPTSVIKAKSVVALAPPAMAQVRFRVLRDGLVTANQKRVRVVRGWATGSQLDMAFHTVGDGEFTEWLDLPLQTLVDQGEWVVIGIDDADPRRTGVAYMQIGAGGTYLVNLTGGGGGEVTDPATVDAVVRVEKVPASRAVVVVERPPTGDWRVAGHGTSDSAGALTVDLAVTGGELYALGLDDFGVAFTGGLSVAVGQRVRPSVFAGVLYEVTEAGVLPAVEPAWWPITTEGTRDLGTARAEAVRYFHPIGLGPFPAEIA